jgi:uncharacterized protein (DUF2147 family)
MIESMRSTVKIAAVAAFAAAAAGPAYSAEPVGLWYDHTGRGAVEITKCGANLCGRLVWLKDEKNKKACGLQIVGDVKPVSGGKWDNGWIYDPEKDSKYSVELTPMNDQTLKVVGYMGSKLFSETMTWKRAPADLKRCGT